MKRICLLLALCLLLSGCAANKEPEFVYVKEIASYASPASADFTLPDGYTFADDTTASIVRTSDHQVVGGILDMEMSLEELEQTGHDSPENQYLNSLGYICEYISMNADGYKAVSLYITDEGATERRESSRCLFPRDGKCYDLWFDNAVITYEDETTIRKAVLGK